MNVEDIYEAAQNIKKAIIAKGYTSADCRISFHYVGSPIFISVEASRTLNTFIICKEPTTQEFQEGLAKAELWIHQLPNAKEQAKTEFLKMLEQLPAQAAEYGIELPVKLGS